MPALSDEERSGGSVFLQEVLEHRPHDTPVQEGIVIQDYHRLCTAQAKKRSRKADKGGRGESEGGREER